MAAIIKSGVMSNDGNGLHSVAFNFEDMSDRAARYLDTVRSQAEQILTDAKQRAAEITALAKNAGQQEALAEATQVVERKLDQSLDTLLPAIRQAIAAIGFEKERWLKKWEQETVHLASAMAACVIRRELSKFPEISVDLAREALQLAMGSGRLRLLLNPSDIETLGDRTDQLANEFSNLAPTDIVADESVRPGGCQVVTEFGSLDQNIDVQLRRIEEELT
jgi:flagellar biosynthesis/type III secretory pathway protein FliH